MKKMLIDPEKTGIIAEFKKKSPSKGIINDWSTAGGRNRGLHPLWGIGDFSTY